jgi:hypothetical protein
MAWSRRKVLVATGVCTSLAGCGGSGLGGEPTPAPSAFELQATGERTIELRYTGIGSQDPTRFRVDVTGAGPADGSYELDTVIEAASWSESEPVILNRTTLGLAEPLAVDGVTIELQYRHEGDWLSILRSQPAV